MEILIVIFGLIVAAALTCWLIYFLVSLTVYIFEEINHGIRNAKRDFKQSMWDLEWQWKLMKEARK